MLLININLLMGNNMKRRADSRYDSNKKARLDKDFDTEEELKKELLEKKAELARLEDAIDGLSDDVEILLYDIEADDQFIFTQEELTKENEDLPAEGICQGLSIDYVVHNLKSAIDSPSYLYLLSSEDGKLSDHYVRKIIEYQNILQPVFFPDFILGNFKLEDLKSADSDEIDSLLNYIEECSVIQGKAYMGVSLMNGESAHVLVVGLNDKEYTIYDPSTGEYFFKSLDEAENKISTKQALEVIFAYYRDERGFIDIRLDDLCGVISHSNILKEGQELVKQFDMLKGVIKENADEGVSSFEIIELLSYDQDNFINYIEIIKYEIVSIAKRKAIEGLLKTLQAIPEEFLDEFILSINKAINLLNTSIDKKEWNDFRQNLKNIGNKNLLELLKAAIEEYGDEDDDEDDDDGEDYSSDDSTDDARLVEEASDNTASDKDVGRTKHSDFINYEKSDNEKDTEYSGGSKDSGEDNNVLLEFLLQRLFSYLEAMPNHLQEKFLNSAPIKSLINELSIRVALIMHEVKFDFSYYDKDLDNESSDDTKNNIDNMAKILNEDSQDLVDTELVYNSSVVSEIIFVSGGSTSFMGVSTSYHLDNYQANPHAINV